MKPSPTPIKPLRVTVPVTLEVLEAFQELANVTGTSTGKAMGDWLSDTLEGVQTMQKLLSKARQAPKQAVRELNAYALGLADLSQELLDQVMKKGDAGSAVTLLRSASADPASDPQTPLTPPSSNTGGKVTKGKKKDHGGGR
jgi:hypothetical protein